ncbi:hypothetical protein ABN028_27935 [Actinopolymorpha sp. B17G11]|uniref:hypothetical protein n=1 Tax=Actinopolymorpha sp. B17G11 TaxID=3160861 RepID=UPI0032E3AE66
MHGQRGGERREPAVRTGDDVLPPDEFGVGADALRDELRMLDVVGRGVDDPGSQHLALRQADVGEECPFVGVPWVGRLERQAGRAGGEHQVEDVGQGYVTRVRSLVVAPTKVQP